MRVEELELRITRHAFRQYRKRVAKDRLKELYRIIGGLLQEKDFYRKGDWLHIDGVWWIHAVSDRHVTLVTCYGASSIDLPSALKWAKVQNDSINLKGML